MGVSSARPSRAGIWGLGIVEIVSSPLVPSPEELDGIVCFEPALCEG